MNMRFTSLEEVFIGIYGPLKEDLEFIYILFFQRILV